jgi:hypothetical protein
MCDKHKTGSKIDRHKSKSIITLKTNDRDSPQNAEIFTSY